MPTFLLTGRRAKISAIAVLVLAALLAYGRSYSGPFVFDDLAAIPEGNPAIRHLWPLGPVLSPPPENGQTVGGRPVLNLSLALNYAVSGTAVWSYHALNLTIHILAGLTLFGIVRRTLQSAAAARGNPLDHFPTLTAFVVALLWVLHPLQTEAVTYIIQRAESLMGLFYLLTLYCFIRGVERVVPNALVWPATSPSALGTTRSTSVGGEPFWIGLSFLACFLGMGTKEVMVSAPLIVLLYDRTFVAGSFAEAWRRRRAYYLALAATWIPLALLVAGAHGRGGTAGWDGDLSGAAYFFLELPALAHYLRLAFWPSGLTFDYGEATAPLGSTVALSGLLLLALAAGTVITLRRRPALGFLGACFFAILAPSSSFLPIAVQPMAEHRMYLPLAVVLVGVVLVVRACGRGALLALIPVAAVAGCLTARRNQVYQSPLLLWGDTVVKRPENARARCNWADALLAEGRGTEALDQYAEALRLERPRTSLPGHTVVVEILTNYGNAVLANGRAEEAVARYQEALQFDEGAVKARFNLGSVLLQQNRLSAAAEQFARVLEEAPDYAAAHNNLGMALLRAGKLDEAIVQFRENLRLRPDSPFACFNYGNALLQAGRTKEAAAALEAALALKPDFREARDLLDGAGSGGAATALP